MDGIERRIGALEAWREAHAEDIQQIRTTLDEVNRKLGRLLERDAVRRSAVALFAGLPAAVWAAIGGGGMSLLVAYILHGGKAP